MVKRIIVFLLIVGLLVLTTSPLVYTQTNQPLISVERLTIIYPNYAISTDTIKVVNGSLSSLIAQFPDNTIILKVSGEEVQYAYQLSSSPTREVVVFKNPLVSGSTTQIEYVYTGFLNSGQLKIAFQPGYSIPSVNDSASYYYGIQKWGETLQIFYGGHYLNISEGQTFVFNGTTGPNSFVEASNPPTTTMPTSYQAYIQILNREIVYSEGVFHIVDQAIFVWASSSESNQIYLFIPNNIVNGSITVSYFYGNVSSNLRYNAYPGYSLLTVNSPVQLNMGEKVGLQLSYEIKARSLNLSTIGLYGMFCEALGVTANGVKPDEGAWKSMGSNYFASFRAVTAQDTGEYVVSGVGGTNLIDGTSLAVLIAGIFAAASSYTYIQTKNRRKAKRVVSQTLVKSLTDAVSAADMAYNAVRRFLEGAVRASAANSALASFDESQRKILREIGESVAKGEVSEDIARRLTSDLKEIRDLLADLIDLQTQFNQKKIRQSVYLDLKAKYQRGLQRALNSFKDAVAEIKSS